MEVIIRGYLPEDGAGIVRIYKNALETLRKSKGGDHDDYSIDKILSGSDKKILSDLFCRNDIVLVADAEGIPVGFTSFSNRLIDKILKSTYGSNIYVAKEFQRGKIGVNVGRMLVSERKRLMSKMNYRKYYSYSTPESVAFGKKCGVKYYPAHNTYSLNSSLALHYYEFILRPSFLNKIRIEPYLFELSILFGKALGKLKGR
ncbi:GNAT family N-acetyltransferase [Candidatus Micrarchaeota archaeon]|nr:GNAT family N-acetyltransferase [Candidatus Micrarchaeota archaeon]MBU1681255.1 GNAT family N-acetyltransferase [Candidatus Micrarchaeota archaeon]